MRDVRIQEKRELCVVNEVNNTTHNTNVLDIEEVRLSLDL